MTVYSWQEIGAAPLEAGVYAWYYTPEITEFDLTAIVEEVSTLKTASQPLVARQAIRDFLDETIFKYFREQPFTANLRGTLKPRYEGRIEHTPSMSESLLDRIVEDPTRLATIRDVLETSAPNFASPMYIGMSEKLRARLRRHKALIERYNEMPTVDATDDDERDQSFAREIRTRNIPPTRLFVVVKVIQGSPGTYVDCENILNRIHYPLLGRN